MEIINLSKEEFDSFASNHPYRTFYQTSQYGLLMKRHGFEDLYLGFLNNDQKLQAATLLLCRRGMGNKAIGYAPRGFLVDYSNPQLLEDFSNTLRKHLKKLGFISVTLDPAVVRYKRDVQGFPIESEDKSNQIIEQLKKLGYQHRGFNLYFENLKPRWNMITRNISTPQELFSKLDKNCRNRIRKMNDSGVRIYRGTADDILLFYSLIQQKHTKRDLNYYLNYYEVFSKNNMFEIYFAALSPEEYLLSCKKAYESEVDRNNELIKQMENNKNINETILNNKIESDRLLNIFQKNLINATDLLRKHKDSILLNTTAVVKFDKEITFLIDGFNPKFKQLSAAHLLKWSIMEKYIKEGYTSFNHNGISGDFNQESKYYGLYQFKRSFNSEIVEYIGEFDFIVNAQIFSAYTGIKPLNKIMNQFFNKQ